MRFSIRKLFSRKSLVVALAILGGLLFFAAVGATIAVTVTNVRGEKNWRHYRAEATRRGVKLELKDFILSPVPAEQNFAAIAPFEKVFADRRHDPNFEHALKLPSYPKPPAMGGPVAGRVTDLAELRGYCVELRWTSKDRAAALSPAAAILTALERFEPTLKVLREASHRPESRFPVRWEEGVIADQPHLDLLTSAAKLGRWRSLALAEEGRTEEAANEVDAILRYVRRLEGEVQLITGLVSLSITSMACDQIWEGLARQTWSDAHLVRFEKELAVCSPMRTYRASLDGERILLNHFYSQLADPATPGRDRVLRQWQVDSDGVARTKRLLHRVAGWIRDNQVLSNRYVDEFSQRIDLQQERYFLDWPVPSDGIHITGYFARLYYLFHIMGTPIYDAVEKRSVFAEGLVRRARLAVALERHRLAKGRYPDALEELVPAFLAALPRDILTGESFRYRLESEGGFCLYSVGLDLKDDGGIVGFMSGRKTVPQHKRGIRQDHWNCQLDWVWEYPPKP